MRARTTALVLALTALLGGCVTMPDSGPVVETRSEGDVVPGAGIFFDPKPPQPGDTRPDIVRGFLNAMRATPIQTRTAREFLSADADAAWDPKQETITYVVPPTPRETAEGMSISLDGADHLDSRGAWQGALPEAQRTVSFPMSLEDGEWRIDEAPDALIVPQNLFQDRYRQVSLYFFDPTASILEPEPVFVPRGEQLASTLTQALLMGPSADLRHVAQTFVPAGLKVAVGVTVSDDGVADILLSGDAGQLAANTIELMMAQFAWTLRQEPAIESIRVSINGEPVPLPGGVSSYRVDGGAEFDPAGFRASPSLYGLRNGMVVSGTAAALEPVDGPLGEGDLGLRSIGVRLDAGAVAGVGAGGTSVLVGPLGDPDRTRVQTVVSGGSDFLKPAWDFADRMWLVDRTEQGARVSFVQGNQVRELRVPGVSGRRVLMFLVSRDGTRLVAVVRRPAGDVLVVSRIEHAGTGRVIGATPAERIGSDVNPELPIRAIAWRTTTKIAVLNPFTATLAEVGDASVDGSPAAPDSAAVTIEGRMRGLAGSPALDQSLYGITPASLVVIASADLHAIPLEDGTTAVGYVG